MVTHRKGRMKADATVEAMTSPRMGSSTCILVQVGGGIVQVLPAVCVIRLIDRESVTAVINPRAGAVFVVHPAAAATDDVARLRCWTHGRLHRIDQR